MSEEEYYDVDELVSEVNELKAKNRELHQFAQNKMYQESKDSNLISEQLNAEELLQKLERFYRGDYLGSDDKGNVFWKQQTNEDLIPLNEFGVSTLMEIVTKYIDKNTTLSNYPEERIYEILADLGEEINLAMFCNYEKMGMDTPFKKTKYRLIITTTLHIIESTYRRSIGGKTAEGINQSKIVTQSDVVSRPQQEQVRASRLKELFTHR